MFIKTKFVYLSTQIVTCKKKLHLLKLNKYGKSVTCKINSLPTFFRFFFLLENNTHTTFDEWLQSEFRDYYSYQG